MRIGFYVQGAVDEAFIEGLRERYCPKAEVAKGRYRGQTKESHRREIRNNLKVLHENDNCDYIVILTDSDNDNWREVKKREWERVPEEYRHKTIFGVAERNIECWLAIDQDAIANELNCNPNAIPKDDPSGFIKSSFGFGKGDDKTTMKRITRFVVNVSFYKWLKSSRSFEDFWGQIFNLSKQNNCHIPNERERTT